MLWAVDINVPDRCGFYITTITVKANSKEQAMEYARSLGYTPAGAHTAYIHDASTRQTDEWGY